MGFLLGQFAGNKSRHTLALSIINKLQPGRNYHDTLELQHFGPLTGLNTMGRKQLGKGHDFQNTMLLQVQIKVFCVLYSLYCSRHGVTSAETSSGASCDRRCVAAVNPQI